MRNRINVGSDVLFRRSNSLNSTPDSNSIDPNKLFNRIQIHLESISDGRTASPSLNTSLRSYIESISNTNDANVFKPLYLIQELDKRNLVKESDYVFKEFTNRVLPYIENLSTVEESVNRYNISDNKKDLIIESVNKINSADRILKNHEKISKRFNIENNVSKIKSIGLYHVAENCCEMIDTYKLAPYAKFNLCLEELSYLLNKNGYEYNKQDLVKYVTEYFLIRTPQLSSTDLKGFRTVLNENCCISDEDTNPVDYVINGVDQSYLTIKKNIQSFMLNQNKDLASLINTIKTSLDSIDSYIVLLNNIDCVIWLIWDVFKNDLFEMNCSELFNMISAKITSGNYSKNELYQLVDKFKSIRSIIKVKGIDQDRYRESASQFQEFLTGLIDHIMEIINFASYPQQNINALEYVNRESVEIPLNEFKLFKFHNLVRAAVNLDKFLKFKAKKIYSKGAKATRKVIGNVSDVLFGESMTDFYSSIGSDSKSDICIERYYFNESNIEETHELFNEICKEFNNKLICENSDSIRAYYIMNPGVVEVHLKESSTVQLSESDWDTINEIYENDLDLYIEEFAYNYSILDLYSVFTESELNIDDRLTTFFSNKNLTLEHFEVTLEALSLLGSVNESQVKVFGEQFANYRYNTALLESTITESEYNKESIKINNLVSSWNLESNVPLDAQLEAFYILDAVLEAAPQIKKPKVGGEAINNAKKTVSNVASAVKDKVSNIDFKKNPFAGINLKSMKLYLQGLKSNIRKMSQKERELSRNIDNSYRVFVKTMKSALISDRREAIIKGSVIPSFSRCMKIAIGLAGVGLVTGNPVIPLMIAMGGFAMSKRLTQKERLLLLDEIETELDVVDKEISMAESKNQMKKYRTLLTYKKNLQRQYQRIRYNIRVGKDILPGSAAGIPNKED